MDGRSWFPGKIRPRRATNRAPASEGVTTGRPPRTARRPVCITSIQPTAARFTTGQNRATSKGQWYQGSTVAGIPTDPSTGSIIAVDPSTGETKWKFPLVTPPTSGLLSTAGGLVFAGDREGYLFALDARSGKPLWRFQTGGAVVAPPITYLLDGKQYVAVAASSSILTFALP